MHVLLWGCGNMAGALARGLQRKEPTWRFTCWTPTGTRAQALAREINGVAIAEASAIPADVDAVVLGFKPQMLASAAPALKDLAKNVTVVSLLAAVSLEKLANYFPAHPMLRLMPNLAIEQNAGVVLWWSEGLTQSQHSTWQAALQTLGLSREVDEEKIDLYTLPAASSPAFLYYWLQGVGEFARSHGGDANEAVLLMVEALKASLNSGNISFDQLPKLISAVASKGGVTQAGIDEWQKLAPDYVQQGFSAGLKRLSELKA